MNTATPIPGFMCGVCLGPVTDADARHNYSDHPHDGYWCGDCLSAYSLPRDEALALLSTRLHELSQISVNTRAVEPCIDMSGRRI